MVEETIQHQDVRPLSNKEDDASIIIDEDALIKGWTEAYARIFSSYLKIGKEEEDGD